MLHSNKYPYIILSILLITAISCVAKEKPLLRANGYIISATKDELSKIWGEYLYNHLEKRCTEKGIVVEMIDNQTKILSNGFKDIHLEVNPDVGYDYCIDHTQDRLHIKVRNAKTALWIIYQLIDNIASLDNRFDTSDLPPSIINFENECEVFDFSYREPYFAPNLDDEYSDLIGTNSIEKDWGLWGHSLSKIIKEPVNEDVYSLVNGIRNREQFSFSSLALFKNICDYIVDNYGEGTTRKYKFMIMPNDNELVCTCPACVALGNTSDNATPAVTDLINKLAERFPNHIFFTTGYRTTSKLPINPLPDNAGVFISTIDLPKGIKPDYKKSSIQSFSEELNKWKGKTANIYLWDYASNFDDYLTPLPIIYGLQKQFLFFKSLGVKGIFLNASGYDYSPFEDVKTFLVGALMMNAEIDIDSLCRKYFEKEYPISHKSLSDYYLSTEHQFDLKNKPYDMYGGINQIVNSYLNTDRFIQFYNILQTIINKTEGEEQDKLKRLFTALTYTRLQIAYVKNDKLWGAVTKVDKKLVLKSDIKQYIDILEEHNKYQELINYRETGGKLDDYISEWRQIDSSETFKNVLIGVPIEVLSGANEYNNTYILNDGMPGFSLDYHQGWYLSSSGNLHVSFPTENLSKCTAIKLRFLRMERHSIYPPEKIKIIINNKEITSIEARQIKENEPITDYIIPIDFSNSTNIELEFIRKQAGRSIIACDEIVII